MNAAEQQALSAWWTQHMGPLQAPLQFMPLTGGQSNPTYRVSSGGQQWVLRSQPGGALLASAHAVDREYRVMQALADTDVPVPRMRALCTDASVIGRSFYVMDFIDGRVFIDPSLPGMSVPAGFGADGMPVGLQLIGNYFQEARLLGAAHHFQCATDWHTRAPKEYA